MSQQYEQFEKEFRDGPRFQPYQAGYDDENVSGQKLLDHKPNANSSVNISIHLGLAIVSIVFVFIMFIVAMTTPVSFATIFFTLLFTAIVVTFNIIFYRTH